MGNKCLTNGSEIGFTALSNSAWYYNYSPEAGWISWARVQYAVIIWKLFFMLKTYGASSDLSWEKLKSWNLSQQLRKWWRGTGVLPRRTQALCQFLVHMLNPESCFTSNNDCLKLHLADIPPEGSQLQACLNAQLENTAWEK